MMELKMGITKMTMAPTASLRFKDRNGRRILQQMFWIVTLSDPGIIVKQRGEWRDVECVGAEVSDQEPQS